MVDHRPFLRPGVDLITAEDVLAWMDTPLIPRIEAERSLSRQRWCSEWDVLRVRLDRERRQACRRGALAMWRAYRASLGPDMDWDDMPAAWVRRQQERHRNAAIAYRAAARAQ